MVLGKLYTHMSKNEIGKFILQHTHNSIQSGLKTWMQDLETIKLLGEKLLEISLSNDFLDITVNSTDNKSRIKQK